jgi:broad specificity phosphatase PhoE
MMRDRESSSMSIFVIRHGETASNANRVLQVPETPLSERGLAQAERLGRRMAELGVTHILSSDYARAHMTARAVSDATGLTIEIEPSLRERNFGDLRGRPYSEVGDIFAEGFEPRGGESWETFYARTDRSWQIVSALARECTGSLAVVTHGLVCKAFVERSASIPDGLAAPAGYANTSVTVVAQAPPWRIERLNCAEHLDDETTHDAGSVSGL